MLQNTSLNLHVFYLFSNIICETSVIKISSFSSFIKK